MSTMNKVRILIVEDEVIISSALKAMLEGLGYEVPAIYRSGKDLLANFREDTVDMIMMDIQLADNTNGIDTSKALGKLSDVPIVYITNNKEDKVRKKAIDETNAVYFINKPFTINDICSAIDLTLKFLKKEEVKNKVINNSSYLLNDAIFIKDDFSFKKIKLSEILFLKADGSYCHLQCRDRQYTFSENLSFFENKLLFAGELIRVHRSFVVNINHIDKIQENRVWVNGHEIPVGKTYRKSIFDKFNFI